MYKHFFWLIAIILIGCNKMTSTSVPQQVIPDSMKQQCVLDVMASRVSVRQFTGKKLFNDQVQTLLHAAMTAPSAMNKQPWAFLVITDQQKLDEIGTAIPGSRCANGAAVAFVMCGDLTKALSGEAQGFWINDVSAATQNLLLAAHAMGLGAVWTGVHPDSERVHLVQNMLQLPDSIIPMCIVPVGYSAEQPLPKDKFNEANIHYNQW